MRGKFATVIVVVLLSACGSVDLPPFDSIFSRVPRVVAVEPTDGATAGPGAAIVVEFSERIDPASVGTSTLAILLEEEDPALADLVEALGEGEAKGVEGIYEFAGEGRVATFRAREPYTAGMTYRVIATAGIMSVERLPLAKPTGRSGDAFMSVFTVSGNPDAREVAGSAGGGAGADEGTHAGAKLKRPSFLVINELLYDVPGDDTNGVLFVELYGEAGADIGDYRVVFVNGDDGSTTEEIKIPKGARLPEDGIFLIADSKTGQSGVSAIEEADFIDNFDPQNGPDCAQLLDDQGRLLDALGYGTPIVSPAADGHACYESTPAEKAVSGSSLSRRNGIDLDDNANDFYSKQALSPGIL